VELNLQDSGNPLADATISTVLPSYITYTNVATAGADITYNSGTRTVTWNAGDITSGGQAQAAFQVSITPSTSQRQSAPYLTNYFSYTGYDRIAGVPISGQINPVTTQTPNDPGYTPTDANVQ
jgi:hypothetical protein